MYMPTETLVEKAMVWLLAAFGSTVCRVLAVLMLPLSFALGVCLLAVMLHTGSDVCLFAGIGGACALVIAGGVAANSGLSFVITHDEFNQMASIKIGATYRVKPSYGSGGMLAFDDHDRLGIEKVDTDIGLLDITTVLSSHWPTDITVLRRTTIQGKPGFRLKTFSEQKGELNIGVSMFTMKGIEALSARYVDEMRPFGRPALPENPV